MIKEEINAFILDYIDYKNNHSNLASLTAYFYAHILEFLPYSLLDYAYTALGDECSVDTLLHRQGILKV